MSAQHVVSVKTYLSVFAALIILTLTTVGIATIDLGPLNTIAALLIAAIKATVVILFFMHVRYSKPLIGVVVLGAVLWLAILIGLTLADFMSRSWR
jgi:cytochrome c oxidase subunit IV